jgi:hypothetical protein
MAYDPTNDEGLGAEGLIEDSTLPLIKLIQQLSPEINENEEKYIEGAKVGDLFFAPTTAVIKQPASFIPTAFRTMYVEWKPKTLGGGIVGTHPLSVVTDPEYKKGVKTQYDEWLGQNELKKTTYILGLVDIDGPVEAMIALSGAGQKIARTFQKNIRNFRYSGKAVKVVPPVFAQTWDLTSVYEKNSEGQGFYSVSFSNPRILDFTKDEGILNTCSAQAKKAQLTLPSVNSETKAALPADSDNY